MKYLYSVVFLFVLTGFFFRAEAYTFEHNVPFTSQAPLGSWSWPWQDFCEESSVAMAYAFQTAKKPSYLEFALEMLKLAVFELRLLGYEKDTNLEDTQKMFSGFYNYKKTRILENPSIKNIESEILNGNLVLAPVAGKILLNPHFHGLGPRYHMVVIKGFDSTKKEFITNDPGTKFGNGWRYDYETIMNALHDYVPEDKDIILGRKAVLVIDKL